MHIKKIIVESSLISSAVLCNSWVFSSAAGGGDGYSHWGNICGSRRYFKGNLPQWTCHTNRNNVSMNMLFELLQIWPVTYLLNGIKYFFLLILRRWFKNKSCFVLDYHIFPQNMMSFIAFLLLTTIRMVKMTCVPLISRKTVTHILSKIDSRKEPDYNDLFLLIFIYFRPNPDFKVRITSSDRRNCICGCFTTSRQWPKVTDFVNK